MFPFVVQKVIFKFLRNIPWETQAYIIISKQTAEVFTTFFSKELFQYQIHSKQYIFYLYHLIFQKHLQPLHINTGRYPTIFFERTVSFLPATVFNKISPFLTFTECLFIFPFLHIFFYRLIVKISFFIN